ncbi:MAG TPA: type VI secretion system lipoprotein TssJ [Candidatus Eisenbacteria bacterium]|nr:type VI secretion system lipoprotein TssJ [Candidatus Eisenbacteria bacterium]
MSRQPRPALRPGRALRVAALAALLALASGCAGKLLGKGTLHVTLTATPDCNSCGRPTGYPLTFRVLQVTDASAITGMSLTQLWDKEDKLLGAAFLDKKESFIDPGETKELPVERKPGAVAMIVVGNFCRSRGSCWFYAQSLARGGSVKLVAGADCLSAAK